MLCVVLTLLSNLGPYFKKMLMYQVSLLGLHDFFPFWGNHIALPQKPANFRCQNRKKNILLANK